MGNPHHFRRLLPLLIITLFWCGAASASTITITTVDMSRGESIWLNLDGIDTQIDFAGVLVIGCH